MLVDDSAQVRAFLRELLAPLGAEFIECADGAEAVRLFTFEQPDWTVMDVVMPQLDGLEATRRIRARFPAARIVIVTQHDHAKVRHAAAHAGSTAYFGKDDLFRLPALLQQWTVNQSHKHCSVPLKPNLSESEVSGAMKTKFFFSIVQVLAVSWGLYLAPSLRAEPLHTQTFTLQPGWNSLWLEVQPTNKAATAVFAGLPLESVWTFQARLSAVQFIADPNEAVWNRSAWRVFVPTNRVEAFQNNLFSVHANRPYLVHVTNTTPLNWSVTGVLAHRQREWVPDSYNLCGFPADPASAPTFANFFRAAPAHFDPATGQLRKMYRLNSSGQWTLVNGADTMQRGVAYWVFAKGRSDFTAPLHLTLADGDGLDYGGAVTELSLDFKNLDATARNILVHPLAAPSVLSYYRFSTNNAETWPSLPSAHTISLAAGAAGSLRLAVRRQDFSGAEHASLLEISDGAGTLHRVPVTAGRGLANGVPPAVPATPQEEAHQHAGLWVGTVTLNAMAEVNSGQLVTNSLTRAITRTGVSTNATPTRSELNMRLLLHVDTNGVTRLLRDVIQMWQDGVYTNDPSGFRRAASSGRFVLLTDERLVPQFKGAAQRDGVPVGRRLSTVSYDFDAGTDTFLPLAGMFAVSNRISGTLSLAATAPTNPFRHKYHPDHDNLDATFRNFREEAYPVTRQIELEFTASDPAGGSSPDYGHGVIGGIYRETVTGLHKDALHAQGVFRLSRVAATGVLNQ